MVHVTKKLQIEVREKWQNSGAGNHTAVDPKPHDCVVRVHYKGGFYHTIMWVKLHGCVSLYFESSELQRLTKF